MAKKNLMLVEGDNEVHFFKEFRKYFKFPSDIKKLNVLQNRVDNSTKMKKYDNVYFVFDIDVLINESNSKKGIAMRQNLENNYKEICASNKYLLLECQNFEDEIVECSDGITNFNDLCKCFKCVNVSKSEFKEKFNSCRLLEKTNWVLDRKKLYKKGEEYSSLIKMERYRNKIKNGSHIFKK